MSYGPPEDKPGSVLLAVVLSVATWLLSMRSGVRALEGMKN